MVLSCFLKDFLFWLSRLSYINLYLSSQSLSHTHILSLPLPCSSSPIFRISKWTPTKPSSTAQLTSAVHDFHIFTAKLLKKNYLQSLSPFLTFLFLRNISQSSITHCSTETILTKVINNLLVIFYPHPPWLLSFQNSLSFYHIPSPWDSLVNWGLFSISFFFFSQFSFLALIPLN